MLLLESDILDDELRDTVRRDVVRSVDGMFLLAQLHMNNLRAQPTKGDIKEVLQHLAKGKDGLEKTYEQAMERINDQGSRLRDIANHILGWITHAKRPLSTVELRHALAVKPGTAKLNEDYLPSAQLIQSVCARLVTADKESGIIRLVHYTTQEYFKKTRTRWFPETYTSITNVCVTYFSFDIFDTGFCETDDAFEERLQTNALYDYAAQYWGYHASKESIENNRILNLLESRAKVSAASQAMMATSFSAYSQHVPRQMTGVHVAAYFGLEQVTMGLLDSKSSLNYDVDLEDSYGRTPLSWAVKNGHEAVVKLLLNTGKINVNSKDNNGRTLLLWAAEKGNEAVVKLLLDTGKVDVDLKDSYGWNERTPLSWAVANGHEAMVKLLLNTGKVNVDLKDSHGQTPLSWAAMNGDEAVVKLLLNTGKVNVNLKDSYGGTPLWWAAENGDEALVKLLLGTGKVDVNLKDKGGRSPLSRAVDNRHEAVVKLLQSHGTNS
jgi:ankyrin repeat protein